MIFLFILLHDGMNNFHFDFTEFFSILLSFLQVVYFQACEMIFLKGHQKATYLYTLMFYNVISYCSNYAKEVYERKQWLPYVTITETSQVKHLGMSATKITLEWTKVSL